MCWCSNTREIPDRDLIKRVIGLPGDTVECATSSCSSTGPSRRKRPRGSCFRQTPGATGRRGATHAGISGPSECRRTGPSDGRQPRQLRGQPLLGRVAANPRERQGALSLLVCWRRRLASAGSHVPTDSLARVPSGTAKREAVRRLFRELRNALLIALGILSAGMGLQGFLLSSNFIDGGVTGISMLLAKDTPVCRCRSAAGHQPAVRRHGLPPDGRRVRGAKRAGHRRPRGGPRDDSVSRRHAGPGADGRVRRVVPRSRHRAGDSRRCGAGRHRDRGAAHQPAQTC